MKVKVGKIDVRYKVKILVESIYLKVGVLNVEVGVMMILLVKNRLVDIIDSRIGLGLFFIVLFIFIGVGYVSLGGGIYNSIGYVVYFSGFYYDSFYRLKERGSFGGKFRFYIGGRGGGVIDLEIVFELLVDGEISIDGFSGDFIFGGGSGGIIYVKFKNLEGYGFFIFVGGFGVCGGLGGCIVFWFYIQIYFFGIYEIIGGVGRLQIDLISGGLGLVYINDIRFGRLYQQFILDNNV